MVEAEFEAAVRRGVAALPADRFRGVPSWRWWGPERVVREVLGAAVLGVAGSGEISAGRVPAHVSFAASYRPVHGGRAGPPAGPRPCVNSPAVRCGSPDVCPVEGCQL